jgi:hypothetical protein
MLMACCGVLVSHDLRPGTRQTDRPVRRRRTGRNDLTAFALLDHLLG